MTYKICALIPTYNHTSALSKIIPRLLGAGLEILMVDDGSDAIAKNQLNTLKQSYPSLQLLTLAENMGKGAAIKKGLYWAAAAGYTHAFQLDADGQHALDNLENFLTLSQENPQALVSGKPIYDASIPLSRRIGRWITHIWVWVETLSFCITDSMCGFRIYPIAPTISILKQHSVGQRMDFDTEIMVRLFWQQTPIIMNPVKVVYPKDNISHFKIIADNWRITKMHTRLFFGMLKRLPNLLFKPHKPASAMAGEKWANIQERGSLIGLYILAQCYRFLGRRACLALAAPVVSYFYFTGKKQRQASAEFLARVFIAKNLAKSPTISDGLKHFMSFSAMVLDKFAAWTGNMDLSQIEPQSLQNFRNVLSSGKGGVLLVSHLGNMEFCRAVSDSQQKQRVHVLLHSKNSQHYHRLLKTFNSQSELNILEVSQLDPGTMIYLKDRVAAGDWVVIAADRIPVAPSNRIVAVPFLGKKAPFSQGPYILAALLQCQVYTVLAIREKAILTIHLDLFASQITLNKQNREASLKQWAEQYAQHLAYYCLRYPYQWFNFFDFWNNPDEPD
jgi:predicted LPLAT superfamily acyltransferase